MTIQGAVVVGGVGQGAVAVGQEVVGGSGQANKEGPVGQAKEGQEGQALQPGRAPEAAPGVGPAAGVGRLSAGGGVSWRDTCIGAQVCTTHKADRRADK